MRNSNVEVRRRGRELPIEHDLEPAEPRSCGSDQWKSSALKLDNSIKWLQGTTGKLCPSQDFSELREMNTHAAFFGQQADALSQEVRQADRFAQDHHKIVASHHKE